MKNYEKIALDTFLSDYPLDRTYSSIIGQLQDGDSSDILIWSPFENADLYDLADYIETLADTIQRSYNPVLYEISEVKLQEAIAEFIFNDYGETPIDAAYNLTNLSRYIAQKTLIPFLTGLKSGVLFILEDPRENLDKLKYICGHLSKAIEKLENIKAPDEFTED